MGRTARVVFAVALFATFGLVAGCAPIPTCPRGHYFNHPTMTANNLTFGNESRVRWTTEGATGGVK